MAGTATSAHLSAALYTHTTAVALSLCAFCLGVAALFVDQWGQDASRGGPTRDNLDWSAGAKKSTAASVTLSVYNIRNPRLGILLHPGLATPAGAVRGSFVRRRRRTVRSASERVESRRYRRDPEHAASQPGPYHLSLCHGTATLGCYLFSALPDPGGGRNAGISTRLLQC